MLGFGARYESSLTKPFRWLFATHEDSYFKLLFNVVFFVALYFLYVWHIENVIDRERNKCLEDKTEIIPLLNLALQQNLWVIICSIGAQPLSRMAYPALAGRQGSILTLLTG